MRAKIKYVHYLFNSELVKAIQGGENIRKKERMWEGGRNKRQNEGKSL